MRRNRFFALALICLACSLFLHPLPAQGEASSEDIVARLAEMYFGSSRPDELAQLKQEARAQALDAPTQDAHILLLVARPVSSDQVIRLADDYELQLSHVRYEASLAPDLQVAGEFAGFRLFSGTLPAQFAAYEATYLNYLNQRLAATARDLANADDGTSASLRERLDDYLTRRRHFRAEGLDYYLVSGVIELGSAARLIEQEPEVAAITVIRPTDARDAYIESQPKLPFPMEGSATSRAALGQAGQPQSASGDGLDDLTCGAGADESCPPDITWLPNIDGATWSASSQVQWNSFYTVGDFYSAQQWSLLQIPNPYSNNEPFVVNTSAFSGPASLPDCVPQRVGFAAPCTNPDGIQIPYPSYEAEGDVPNPACSLPSRTGTVYDIYFGCFYHLFWDATLPGAYIDTTLSDGPDTYSATVGAFRADQIGAGAAYETYVLFYSLYANDVTGLTLNFGGQVGTSSIWRPLCYIAGPAYCVFATDTALLGSAIYTE